MVMKMTKHYLLLADDDPDDRIFFKEAIEDLPVPIRLSTVSDGVELMDLLTRKQDDLPDILFLDLNMPRKTGYQCLSEIKRVKQLADLPVIVLSTSYDHDIVSQLYEKGVSYYIRKPGDFAKLKELIHEAISLVAVSQREQPGKENFILNAI
jgi:CheY-like chemotaxis protein